MLSDFASHLDSCGHGTSGTDLFYGLTPDDEAGDYDSIVTLHARPGRLPIHTLDRNPAVKHAHLQVVVRNTVQATAWTKIEAIRASLDGIHTATVGSSSIISVLAQNEPHELGVDENDRYVLAEDFLVTY